jgi:ankyrin repeat protein
MKRRQFLHGALSLGAAGLLPGVGLTASGGLLSASVVPAVEPLIPIWEAATGGHWNIVKEWLRRDPSLINVRGSIGSDEAIYQDVTLLHEIVSMSSNVEMMKFLIGLGADVNAKMCLGWTPLHCASISNDDKAVLKYLVSAGADVNAKDDFGLTPLHTAAWRNKRCDMIGAVKFLIDSGADVNMGNNDGCTPLHFAAYKGELDVVKILIDSGVELMAKNGRGETPLCSARQEGHSEVVKFLVCQHEKRIGQKRFVWEE